MIQASDAFIGVCRVSRDGFIAALRQRPANPDCLAERDPGDYWQECRAWGVDPTFLLGMFLHESSMGVAGTATETRSWGNTRSPSFGAVPIDLVAGRSGHFPQFASWLDGCASTAARLASPIWPTIAPYGERASIGEVFAHPSGAVWAPAGDLNDPHGYLASMLTAMNAYNDQADEPITATRPASPPVVSDYLVGNHSAGRWGHPIAAIILHITAGASAASAINWFKNPASNVSSHYVVDRNGTIYATVRDRDTAWVNGVVEHPNLSIPIVAEWVANGINPNLETIGIEVAGYSSKAPTGNPGLDGYSEEQFAALAFLLPELSRRHGVLINDQECFGHCDISGTQRANCPGLSAADWQRIYALDHGPPYDTADEAYNAHCAATGDEVVWAGQITGRRHWCGFDPQPIARTFSNRLLAYDGALAQDVTGRVIDDWQTFAADQLTIWGWLMPKTLEGFVDDGRAAPLPGISAVVTVVGDGTVVASGVSGPDGHWQFDDLPDAAEYFVNLVDGQGNAIVRGPWSGEVRDVWVRDRLAVPDTAQAALPNGGNTTVGGLPLVLDPDPLNVIEWRAGGIFSAGAVGLTEEAADLRYEPIDTAYTKAEADARYPLKTDLDPYPNYLTTTEADTLFLTQAEGDARYPLKTDPNPYPTYLTQAEADALYDPLGGGGGIDLATADANYVNVVGDTMSGLLRLRRPTPGDFMLAFEVTGASTAYLGVTNLGAHQWSDGVAYDTTLARTASGVLSINSSPVMTQATADTRYVNVTGDTMSGDLSIIRDDWVTVLQFTYADSKYPTWRLGQAGGSQASPTNTVAGAPLGKVDFQRRVNNTWVSTGNIEFTAQGTAAATNWATLMRVRLGDSAGVLNERLRVDEVGTVKVNPLTDPALPAAFTAQPGLLVQHEGTDRNGLSLARASSADTNAEALNFWRTRGTWASKVAIANGDTIGQINNWAWSGANWLNAAAIQVFVNGTVTTTAIPTTMLLYTADSAGVNTGRLNIGPAGLVGVGAKADGTAAATLDVQAASSANASFITRGASGIAATTMWAGFASPAGVWVFGTNSSGWATDMISATGIGTYATKRIPVYSAGGTLHGYIPLYT